MPNTNRQQVRNIALIGHEHTGKTSLTEALLYHAGAINKKGLVKDGNTASDFDPDEKAHRKSHYTSTFHFQLNGIDINLLDVPGSHDAMAEVLSALRAVDCAAICVDAGAQAVLVNTRRYWKEAEKINLPRIICINRLDTPNAEFHTKLAQVRESFGKRCFPLYWPDGSGESFSKVFNTLHLPDNPDDELMEAHKQLLEAVVETDDSLTERYLSGEELPLEEVDKALHQAVRNGEVFPVFFTAAEKDIGVKELDDALTYLIPTPEEVERKAIRDGKDVVVDPDNGFTGMVYKTVADEFVTRVSYLRIFSGRLASPAAIINRRTGNTEKPGGIYRLFGKDRQEITSAGAGDIVAITKVADIKAGDTVTDDATDITFPSITFPTPMASLAVKPASKKDEQKIGEALRDIEADDPSFHARHETQTGDLVITGISENHLKLLLSRLKTRYKVEVTTGRPHIPYRETVTRAVTGVEYTHKKQSGGAGQFAKVVIDLEPLPRGSGYEFVDKIVGGVIDGVFRPSVDKGVQAKMAEGILAGYPATDLRVRLVDGKTHPVDSKDIAFQIAGREALKKAFMDARPVLLEPIVTMEVTVPQENMGDIMGDLTARRGKIMNTGSEDSRAVISAQTPLAELQGYSGDLESITGGEGEFSMTFDHYEVVPDNLQQRLMDQHRGEVGG